MTKSIEENMFLILEKLVEISEGYPSEYPTVGREILIGAIGLTTIQLTDAINILKKRELVDVVDRSPSGHFKVILRTEGKFEFERMQKEKASLKNPVKEENIMKAISPSINKAWEKIEKEYGDSKIVFGLKIGFAGDKFRRDIIYRDIAHAYILADNGFFKPAVILAGGVIEELLRSYLKQKGITPSPNTFNSYINACKENKLLKKAIQKLTDSFRDFRNIAHLENEKAPRDAISKATAKGAVSSIFSLANDFH